MKKIGIFYGSTTGTTEDVAHRIAKLLGVDDKDIHNVGATAPDAVADYDNLVLGTSTWGSGELQDDWYDFLTGLEAITLTGKKAALFGCGDESMSDTFCNAVAEIHKRLEPTGVTFVGAFPAGTYTFDHSEAVDKDGMAVGLLLDEVNHPNLSESRIQSWTDEVKAALA